MLISTRVLSFSRTTTFRLHRSESARGFIRSSTENASLLEDWSINNMYEFISCNLRIPHYSSFFSFLFTLAWKDSEKQGVARIIETLECVMWSSMDRNGGRDTVHEIDESIIMSNSEIDQCAYCFKSKVFWHGGKWFRVWTEFRCIAVVAAES